MLTQARVRQLLDYNEQTGTLTWRLSRGGKAKAGTVAGTVNHHGYRVLTVDSKVYQSTHVIWLYMTGVLPAAQIDHQNGRSSDDRWDNLRQATQAENLRNRGKPRHNKSGLKGVRWSQPRGGWVATVVCNGERFDLGRYSCPAAAHLAYVVAASRLHGAFMRAV